MKVESHQLTKNKSVFPQILEKLLFLYNWNSCVPLDREVLWSYKDDAQWLRHNISPVEYEEQTLSSAPEPGKSTQQDAVSTDKRMWFTCKAGTAGHECTCQTSICCDTSFCNLGFRGIYSYSGAKSMGNIKD